jgi:hypothetical protein
MVLSCRQAKQECAKAARRKFKKWIARYKETVNAMDGPDVHILLPKLPPIICPARFNMINELTIPFYPTSSDHTKD